MLVGTESAAGMAISVITSVAGSIAPILAAPASVNHRRPSPPTAMSSGCAFADGSVNSRMDPDTGSMTPTRPEAVSVNQSLPSGPLVIASTWPSAVGTGNSVSACVRRSRRAILSG